MSTSAAEEYCRLPNDGQPDVIVQVRHDSESWLVVYNKVVKALDRGVAIYSVLDPSSNSVHTFYADERPRTSEGIVLSVPDELQTMPLALSLVPTDRLSKEYRSHD